MIRVDAEPGGAARNHRRQRVRLKLNARTGVISGKPKAAGTFRFRITAKDALGQRSAERLTLSVRA